MTEFVKILIIAIVLISSIIVLSLLGVGLLLLKDKIKEKRKNVT